MKFYIRIWHFVNVYKPSHKKSLFSKKGQHFSQISILFAQNWHFCPKIDIDRNTCNFASKFTRHYFITGLRTDDFCIKMLISLLKTDIFENGDHLLQKWKNPSKLLFLQDFRFYQWSSHNEKINTSKTNCHFFQNWQLKYF